MRIFIFFVIILIFILIFKCKKTVEFKAEQFFDGIDREFAIAIQENDTLRLKELSKVININQVGKENMTFIMWAIINKSKVGLMKILDLGCNPNFKDNQGDTPIGYVSGLKDFDYLKILLEKGGDPNTITKGGKPVIIYSAMVNCWQNTKLLIERGANINAIDSENNDTLLITIVGLNWFEEVYYLLEKNADITIKNKYGGDFLSRLKKANPNEGSANLIWLQKVKLLLKNRGIEFE